MAIRRSPASSSVSARSGRRGFWAWLALGWLCVAAWLLLLAFNAAPYLGEQPWPSAGELAPRLIALPAALSLPPPLASPLAWIVAGIACFLAIIMTALTLAPAPRQNSAKPAAAAIPPRTPLAPPLAAPLAAPVPDPAPREPLALTTNAAPTATPPAMIATEAPSTAPTPATIADTAPPAAPAVEAAPVATSQRPRVFISHSSADNAFGLELERRLKLALGNPDDVFYDSDGGLRGSDEWLKRLQYEIGQRNVFVLILSPQAFASGWVERELSYALREAVAVGGKVIVPALHQETDVWPFLSDYQMVDFQDNDHFEAAFADLLAAVRLGYSRKAELQGLRGERRGPPFDVAKLPLPERFIGRDADIDWALARLAPELRMDAVDAGNGRMASGLASIAAANGLAGIGKSALAGLLARILYATNRYPDGIAVVACNDLRDPIAVLRLALARFDPEGREPQETTLDALSDLAKMVFGQAPHALIVLDNIEPELDIAQVTKPLRVAGVSLLLTSRHLLPASAVAPGDCRELDLLSLEEAVAVFIENRERVSEGASQASSQGAAVEATATPAERGAIAGIVTALGRHTLAVKLVAARSRGKDLARMARDYAADPGLSLDLRVGAEALVGVIASSVAALPAPARLLFAALGAFASNDIGRDALLAVGQALGDANAEASLDALLDLRLADAWLSDELPAEAERADRERLRLHPLVRAYARDLLDGERAVADDPPWPPERRAEAERAMAAWYADYTNATPDEALDPDEANIGGALAWAEAAGEDRLLARLCNGMSGYWEIRGRTDVRERYLPLAVAAAQRLAAATSERDDRLLAARLQLAYGVLLQLLGDIPGARTWTERSLATQVELDDQRGEGVALSKLGDLALQEGDVAAARVAYQRYLAIMQAVRDQREEGVALSLLGDLALREGDVAAARVAYERYLAIMQAVRDQRGEGVALSKLGDLARQEGDVAAARVAYERYLAIMQAVRDQQQEGVALYKLAQVLELLGELDEAERRHRESLEVAYRVQSRPDVADSLLELGRFLLQHGRGGDKGLQMLGEAEAIYTQLGSVWQAQAEAARALIEQFSGGKAR